MAVVNLAGMKFGRLTVRRQSERKSASGAMWLCVCDCGKETVVASLKLRDGKTVSCGCAKRERLLNFTHGLSNKSKTYRTWKEMRQRCRNPNATQYKWYGGRGIKVCDRWDSYENFLSDMGERPEGKTIDRINPDLGYEPTNCRWATPKEQAATNRGLIAPGSVPKNKLPEEVWESAKAMRDGGMSLRQVATLLGVSYTHCSTKLSGLRGKV